MFSRLPHHLFHPPCPPIIWVIPTLLLCPTTSTYGAFAKSGFSYKTNTFIIISQYIFKDKIFKNIFFSLEIISLIYSESYEISHCFTRSKYYFSETSWFSAISFYFIYSLQHMGSSLYYAGSPHSMQAQ